MSCRRYKLNIFCYHFFLSTEGITLLYRYGNGEIARLAQSLRDGFVVFIIPLNGPVKLSQSLSYCIRELEMEVPRLAWPPSHDFRPFFVKPQTSQPLRSLKALSPFHWNDQHRDVQVYLLRFASKQNVSCHRVDGAGLLQPVFGGWLPSPGNAGSGR